MGTYFFSPPRLLWALTDYCLRPLSWWTGLPHLSWSSVFLSGLRQPTCASRASPPFYTPALAQIGGDARWRQASSTTRSPARSARLYPSGDARYRGGGTPTVCPWVPACRATACVQALVKGSAKFVALCYAHRYHQVRSSSPGQGPLACPFCGSVPRQAPSYSFSPRSARMFVLDASPRRRSAAERQVGRPPSWMQLHPVSHSLSSPLRGDLLWL